MTESVLLMSTWRAALGELGADLGGAVLLGGPGAAALAVAAGAPVREEAAALVTLGGGAVPDLAPGATPPATGAPDGSFDAAVFLAAWSDTRSLFDVAAEAARVVCPGGRVWLGDVDAEALAGATTARYLQALLYRTHPEVADRLRSEHEGSSRMALAAMASGLRPVQVDRVDLPLAAFTTGAEYVEAVRRGLWPGWAWTAEQDRDSVLRSLSSRLAGSRFPVVTRQPWILVHGGRP